MASEVGLASEGQDPAASSDERPSGAVAPGLTLHVKVSEDLAPDALATLAGRGVVLWVQTRSNTLRASLLERLALFDRAFVQVRPPMREGDLAQLSRLPRVGLWVRTDSETPGLALLRGARPFALEWTGPWTPASAQVTRALRPERTLLELDDAPSLAVVSSFAPGEGARILRLKVSPSSWAGCASVDPGTPRVSISLRYRPGLEKELPLCGAKALVEVPVDLPPEALERLISADPGVELEVDLTAAREAVPGVTASLLGDVAAARGHL
jgi:hypothetical protein